MSSEPQHLMQLLAAEYLESVRALPGLTEAEIDIHIKQVQPFWRWANTYLSENRPVAVNNNYDSNYYVQLSNGEWALLSPNVELLRGTMARKAPAIPMTRPSTAGRRDNMVRSGSIPVDGKIHDVPEAPEPVQSIGFKSTIRNNVQDMRKDQPVRDLTSPGG